MDLPITLRPRRLALDSGSEPVVLLHRGCPVCRAEGLGAPQRVKIQCGERQVIATLFTVDADWLSAEEAGLSDAAWSRLRPAGDDHLSFSHPPTLESLGAVRAKLHGNELADGDFRAVIDDIVEGRYSRVELAAFVAACAGSRLNSGEITALTRAMIAAGERLHWEAPVVADKHSVGGLPGNRTSPIVVAIATACGLIMPKTSSRAITSPAGTADTMAVLTDVDLDLEVMRRVVAAEGGCLAWGGAARLSPADDILIEIEKALDLDSEGQLVASVLSKKAAAGATHVVLDVPLGATAKVRSQAEAKAIAALFEATAEALGLTIRIMIGDGQQPVGRGIGPALEARDVLAVLRNEAGAPEDLRKRAVRLAGTLLELAGAAARGRGEKTAAEVLVGGRAWRKFEAICRAQGGLREPPLAPYQHVHKASRAGRIGSMDNRRLARLAKLAGAPAAPAAGILMQVRLGENVGRGAPLFEIHAESRGEMAYALQYLDHHGDLIVIEG